VFIGHTKHRFLNLSILNKSVDKTGSARPFRFYVAYAYMLATYFVQFLHYIGIYVFLVFSLVC